jgi:dolichyl-phosphate beta-glucosyltransferase
MKCCTRWDLAHPQMLWIATAHTNRASKSVVKNTTCSIVIPAYNEAKRIPHTLDEVLAFIEAQSWDAEVIVVNDGSTDDTAAVVRGFCAQHPAVFLIDNPVNCGKGQAIRDGVERASGDVILFTDADNSTPIEDVEKLLPALEDGADIAIGSRWVDPKLQAQPQPWYRRLNGRLYNLLLRSILGMDFKDTQNGFKAYTRRAAKTIFALQKIAGWGFDAETLYLARHFGFTVREIPVGYIYYAEGSKIHPYRDGARMVTELLKVKWYGLTGAYSGGTETKTSSSDLSTGTLQERTTD